MAATVSDKLKNGISINNVVYTKFEVRQPMIDHAQAAEDVAPAGAFYRHNAALLALCMVQMEEDKEGGRVYAGPFFKEMFGKLGRNDFATLVSALNRADDLGNESPKDEQES